MFPPLFSIVILVPIQVCMFDCYINERAGKAKKRPKKKPKKYKSESNTREPRGQQQDNKRKVVAKKGDTTIKQSKREKG